MLDKLIVSIKDLPKGSMVKVTSVALFIDNVKIDIEYDGYYFHKDTALKDRRRDEFLKQDGWKILRIKGRRNVPTFDELRVAINKLLNSDRTYTELVLDDWGLTG
ncbi:DUF559 domain-containing protein [Brevibacillus gelatini]|uniref:DUF559 domain-containing protein n=1 Tax=Brevibacillus gelatini TaxID=1655277 RepID=A0A3M8AQ56_9BACL|nr:DUF559 domain-containing protein [Brevibacillus gelatini]RNB52675.1 DUF559 domain-containing protein [Brevibacillus gelatini]